MDILDDDKKPVLLMTVPASELHSIRSIWRTATFLDPLVEVYVEPWEIEEAGVKEEHLKKAARQKRHRSRKK